MMNQNALIGLLVKKYQETKKDTGIENKEKGTHSADFQTNRK